MNTERLNFLVKETFRLGEKLLSTEFNSREFEVYVNNIKSITEPSNDHTLDFTRTRTVELIAETNIEDLKLNLFTKVFNPYSHPNLNFWPGNSNTDIAKRYIVAINRRLPILLNE